MAEAPSHDTWSCARGRSSKRRRIFQPRVRVTPPPLPKACSVGTRTRADPIGRQRGHEGRDRQGSRRDRRVDELGGSICESGSARVVWGRLDECSPPTWINPLDVSRFFFEGRSEARLPVALVRAQVFLSESVLDRGRLRSGVPPGPIRSARRADVAVHAAVKSPMHRWSAWRSAVPRCRR